MNTQQLQKKSIFTGTVRSNVALSPRFYLLTVVLDEDGSRAFQDVKPGQFAEFEVSGISVPAEESIRPDLVDASQRHVMLRRPFSFSHVHISNTTPKLVRVEVMYSVLGSATLRMTSLSHGDHISIIGPLGNGFCHDESKKTALLVAGGTGAPPMQHMGYHLKSNHPDVRIAAFAGARSIDDLPFTVQINNIKGFCLEEFDRHDIETRIATDDGTAGHKGFVTDCLDQWIQENKPEADKTIIYSCGPEPMLVATAKIAEKYNIDCKVSMERMMACGIGLCQSCAIKYKGADDGGQGYKLCCKDGPVFDCGDIVFETA